MTNVNKPEVDYATQPAASCCGVKSLFGKIVLGLLAAVAILCVVIATRPGEFNVARSATFNATPAAVFEQVNDFHKWEAWSPWAKLDPNVKGTYEGPTSGEGAKFAWAGNSDVGEGSMTIVESKPNELVRIRLEFIKPFAGVSDVEMKIEPAGDDSKLTWSMAGKNNFLAKAITLVFDCDKFMGEQFEQGLANIKAVVENPPDRATEAAPGPPSTS